MTIKIELFFNKQLSCATNSVNQKKNVTQSILRLSVYNRH